MQGTDGYKRGKEAEVREEKEEWHRDGEGWEICVCYVTHLRS